MFTYTVFYWGGKLLGLREFDDEQGAEYVRDIEAESGFVCSPVTYQADRAEAGPVEPAPF